MVRGIALTSNNANMDDQDLQALQTWSTSDLHTTPETPPDEFTINPNLLHFDRYYNEPSTQPLTYNESTASSSPPPPQQPLVKRRRKEPWQYRRSPPSAIEKKYRDKLRSALTELSNAIPATRATEPGVTVDGQPVVNSIEPAVAAKAQKKHTIILKAVEYIKQLEDENRSLLVVLSDRILGVEKDGDCSGYGSTAGDVFIDDELWSDLLI